MRSLFPVAALLALFCEVALADENMVEKREKCQAEARQRIKPHGRVSVELSKALLAKRQDYVRACMDGKLAKPQRKTP
jgi:hypothetical protein